MPLVPPVTRTVRSVMSNNRSNDVRSTPSVKQIAAGRHVFRNGLGRLAGDPLNVVGGPVVPAFAVQTRHGGDVLLDVLRQSDGFEYLSAPHVVGLVLGGDRPLERTAVLLGQAMEVEDLGPGQVIDRADAPGRVAKQGGHDARHIGGRDRRRAAAAEGQGKYAAVFDSARRQDGEQWVLSENRWANVYHG